MKNIGFLSLLHLSLNNYFTVLILSMYSFFIADFPPKQNFLIKRILFQFNLGISMLKKKSACIVPRNDRIPQG